MTTGTAVAVIGAYFLGAVYLGGLIAAGLAWGSHAAVFAALASAASGYGVQVLSGLGVTKWGYVGGLWAVSLLAALVGAVALVS